MTFPVRACLKLTLTVVQETDGRRRLYRLHEALANRTIATWVVERDEPSDARGDRYVSVEVVHGLVDRAEIERLTALHLQQGPQYAPRKEPR